MANTAGAKKTMLTINEVLALKRKNGIHTSYYEEMEMLKAGTCEYGTVFPGKGRNIVRIYRVDLMRWLREKCPEPIAE